MTMVKFANYTNSLKNPQKNRIKRKKIKEFNKAIDKKQCVWYV